jgi:hypothetical protein
VQPHPHTRFRLEMLRNGFWPLLNDCKRPVEKGWPRKRPTEADVMAWDRSLLASTGMRIDGDLAVVDVDVFDSPLVEALAVAVGEKFPALFRHGLVRHAGGPKECWIARVDKPFSRKASRKWFPAGMDRDDPRTPMHCVESFGSLRARQFGVDGPHAKVNGEVISRYAFNDGASPATVPRSELPVLPHAAFVEACNLFNEIAAAAGLTKIEPVQQGHGGRVVYDLVDTMTFENERGSYRLDELDGERSYAAHHGHDFRLTSSFLGHGTNPTKCIVGWSRHLRCVCIYDFETGITHMPADRRDRGTAMET